MAKDGTNRGGRRMGAGKKREGILDGTAFFAEKTAKKKLNPPKKYLTAKQAGGEKLASKKIYEEIMAWIIANGCEGLIPKQLVEDYAQITARHIQCEDYLSQYGLIAKHPTTFGRKSDEKKSMEPSDGFNLIVTKAGRAKGGGTQGTRKLER